MGVLFLPVYSLFLRSRPLYAEVGRKDPLFDVRQARSVARQVAAVYHRLRRGGNFVYHEHPGGHEFDPGDGGIDFLCTHLGVARR